MASRRRLRALVLLGAIPLACATPPRPTATARRISAYPPATVAGRVTDTEGRPVAGIGVRGIPRGADIPWTPPATTDCEGRFRVSLAAPGGYGFLLVWKGESVVTEDPRDPSLVGLNVEPGQTVSGIELSFLPADWARITGSPVEIPSCPPAPAPRP